MDPVVRLVVEVAGILLLGALGEFIFARTRVPDVVWLVAAGILAGPVSGLIPADLLKAGHPVLWSHRSDSHSVKRSVSSPTYRGGRGCAARDFSGFVGIRFFCDRDLRVPLAVNRTRLCTPLAAVGMGDGRRHSRRYQFGYHYANDGHGSGAFQSSAHTGGRVLRN